MKTVVVVLCMAITATLAGAEEAVSFNRDIRPILSDKCFECHGPSERDRKHNLGWIVPMGLRAR